MKNNKIKKNNKIVILKNNNLEFDKTYKKLKKEYNDKEDKIFIITEGKSDTEYLKKIFTKNLKYYMEQKGKNISEVSKELNIKYSTINDWCNAKNYPRVDKIQLLADYFDISKSDLTEKKVNNKVPVLGRIPAGIPIEAIEDVLDYEEIPKSWLDGDKEFFALKIQGDSMAPKYETRRRCYI